MRRFRTTAIILGSSLILCKVLVGVNASPLQDNWSGPVYTSSDAVIFNKGSSVNLTIREYATSTKTGEAKSVVMQFAGPKEKLAALSLTDKAIACSIKNSGQAHTKIFSKRLELTKIYSEREDYNYDSPLCSVIAFEPDRLLGGMTIGFADKPLFAKLEKHNDRGLLANDFQNRKFGPWINN